MSKSKYKEWILETIDQLRKRKARPDLERICHMVERKHGLSFEEILSDLQCLVQEEFVIKVDYKGSTSYRNAAKWRKSHLSGQLLNSIEMARKLQAIVQSICEDGAGEITRANDASPERSDNSKATITGASAQDIEEWLHQNDPGFDPNKINLQLILDREVSAKHMEKLPSGSYVVSEPIPDTPVKNESSSPAASSSVIPGHVPSSGTKSSPSKKGRPPTKRKKIKKSLGPDFEHYSVVKKKRGKSSSAELPESVTPTPEPEPMPVPVPMLDYNEPRCDYCLQTSAANRRGEPENLLICKDCQAKDCKDSLLGCTAPPGKDEPDMGVKTHPSCMDYSDELAKRAHRSPWQCIDCKTCYICEDAGDPDAMLFCDACDKGYHMSCHSPPVEDKPTGKWVCNQCVQELGIDDTDLMETEDTQPNKDIKIEPNGDGTSCLPTPSQSPVNFPEVKTEIKMNGNIAVPIPLLAMTTKTEYPDASDWTIEDVVRFFEDIGFKEQAGVFKDQEIDGKSLLLMKRNDVLTGLSLRLGPALKIYAHVQRLQTQGQCYY